LEEKGAMKTSTGLLLTVGLLLAVRPAFADKKTKAHADADADGDATATPAPAPPPPKHAAVDKKPRTHVDADADADTTTPAPTPASPPPKRTAADKKTKVQVDVDSDADATATPPPPPARRAATRDDSDDPAPVAPVVDAPVAAERPTGHHAIMGHAGTVFTGASVSSLPAVLLGYFPADELATTVGLGFTYNGNGFPTSPLTGVKGAENNRVGSDFMLDVMYFVTDNGTFAMGPEFNFIGSLSPNYPLTAIVITPMWALRYAPWKAPVAIGTGLGVGFTLAKGQQPIASLATQGLDIVYAF
jgi:hypothetical protein